MNGVITDFVPSGNQEEVIVALSWAEIVAVNGNNVRKIANLGDSNKIEKIAFDGVDIYANISSNYYIGGDHRGRGGLVKIEKEFGSEQPLYSHYNGSIVDILLDGSKMYALIVPDYPCSLGKSFIGLIKEKNIIEFRCIPEEASKLSSDGKNLYYAAYRKDRHHSVLKKIEGSSAYPVSQEFHTGREISDLWTNGKFTTVLCRGNGANRFTIVLEDNHIINLEESIARMDLIACDGKYLYAPVFKDKELDDSRELIVFEVKSPYIVPETIMKKLARR